jgi:O-antigen ligase
MLVVRPPVARDPRARPLDLALIASAAAIAGQLVPLPASLLRLVDPAALRVRAALFVAPPQTMSLAPITIEPGDTAAALAIVAGALMLFWVCRHICEEGGTGRIIRAIAICGLIAAMTAIIQRAQNQELIYGLWRPQDAGARPYGPFVNRNHFATWTVMACPLVFAYLVARAPVGGASEQVSQRIASALKQLGSMRVWLVSSVCLMTLAVMLSTSRSGIAGLIAGLALSVWLTRSRRRENGQGLQIRRWTSFQGVVLVLVLLSFANFNSLATRFDQTIGVGPGGRAAIWRVTWGMIRDFPLTGTGAGSFRRAILAYDPPNPGYSTTSAHNHYLQIAAEGGALLLIPLAVVVTCFGLRLRRALHEDDSSTRLIRAGAMSGLFAVMVQNIWETGLLMPANAMLFALLAAVAVHVARVPTHAVQRAY